jgi:hypothetical protein
MTPDVSQKGVVLKVQEILVGEVCEHQIVSACIPINIIFSEVLTTLHIPHTVTVGYSNIEPYSLWHVWVHAVDEDFDIPTITTRKLLPRTTALGQPVYSLQSMYDVIDEDTEKERYIKRANRQIMESYAHTPADIWAYMENNFGVLVETQLLRQSIYNIFGLTHSIHTPTPVASRQGQLRRKLKRNSWLKWLQSHAAMHRPAVFEVHEHVTAGPGTKASPASTVRSSAQKRREQRKRSLLRKQSVE